MLWTFDWSIFIVSLTTHTYQSSTLSDYSNTVVTEMYFLVHVRLPIQSFPTSWTVFYHQVSLLRCLPLKSRELQLKQMLTVMTVLKEGNRWEPCMVLTLDHLSSLFCWCSSHDMCPNTVCLYIFILKLPFSLKGFSDKIHWYPGSFDLPSGSS